MSSLPEHCHGEKTHFSRNEKERLLPSTYTLYVDIPVEVQQDIDFTIEERDLQND
jgi:hypothetical protein